MSVLIDTNILLRSAQPGHPSCSQATEAAAKLLRRSEDVFYCPQTITEFWNVATRSVDTNGLGFSDDEAWKEIESIERVLTLLPDGPGIYPEWKRLVKHHGVRGVKVFDARLAAVANVYGVANILTFNIGDFKRYSGITVLDPASLT